MAGAEEPQQHSRGALQDTVMERQPVSDLNAPAEPKAPRNSRFSSRRQRRNADEDKAADVLASTGEQLWHVVAKQPLQAGGQR